jgi:hypothetical protein
MRRIRPVARREDRIRGVAMEKFGVGVVVLRWFGHEDFVVNGRLQRKRAAGFIPARRLEILANDAPG